MSRRNRSPSDAAESAILLRVRRLVFETLERRSMLAADTESLDVSERSDVGETAGCEMVEERFEPQITECGLERPEWWGVFAPLGGGAQEQDPSGDETETTDGGASSEGEPGDEGTVDAGEATTLWEGVSLEVIRSGGDDPLTLIDEPDSQGEGEEPQIVTCTGVIDWMAPATGFSTDDGSEPTLSLSGPSGDGDDGFDGDSAASEEPVDVTYDGEVEQILDKAVGDGNGPADDVADENAPREDVSTAEDDSGVFPQPVSDSPESDGSGDELPRFDGVFPRHEFGTRTMVFDAGFGVPVFYSRMAISTTANSTSTAAADVTSSSPVDVTAVPDVAEAFVSAPVRGPAATVAADVSQLFAAYASGVGQAAVDHAVASVVGGRRGARR